MSGTIETIRTYPAKGEAGRELTEARLVENMGLEGDFHAKGGDRQISLVSAETRELITRQMENGQGMQGLCFSRFRENISVRGLTVPGLTVPRLTVGDAVLEITGETKHCHEECSLYEAGKSCPLAGRNLFARVLKGGVIRTGDKVEFAQ